MEYLIQKYLKENNLVGINGVDYTLEDHGKGVVIRGWKLKIDEPKFTKTDIKKSILESERISKIAELKILRDNYNDSPVLTKVGDLEFLVKKPHTIVIGKRIEKLRKPNSHPTSEWTDTSGNRVDLTLEQFEELKSSSDDHFDERDTVAFRLYFSAKENIDTIDVNTIYN